ncbi:MAG: energy-coupling factor transporter transmembrane component T family protein [bacterium]
MMIKRIIQLKKNSPLYKLNPTLKIIYLILIFLITIIFNHPLLLLILFLILISISIPGGVIKNILKLSPLIIIMALFTITTWNILLKGSNILLQFNRYIIYKDVLLYSIGMVFRISDAFISGIIILSTTSTEDFNYGFRKLFVPERLTFSIVYALILLPNIFKTISTVELAQRSRGFSPEGSSILKSIKRYISLLTPTILYTLKNANHISMALESKAFGYTKNPVFIKEYNIRKIDIILISSFTIFIILAFYLRSIGYGYVIDRL